MAGSRCSVTRPCVQPPFPLPPGPRLRVGAGPGGVGIGGRREGRCKNVTTLLFMLPTCMLSLDPESLLVGS